MADCKAKGRTARGEKNARSKLTEADVGEVRRLYRDGVSKYEIADRFGLSWWAIYAVVTGRHWSWLASAAQTIVGASEDE